MTALRVLLVTALIAPVLLLTGCGCKDECSYDKMCDQYKK